VADGLKSRGRLSTGFRHYRLLLRLAWRAQLQYRANFLTVMLGGITLQGIQLLFLGVLLAKFKVIAGWDFTEVAFLFAIRLAAHSFYVVPFGALLHTDVAIQEGDFDRYLLRPVTPFLQLITRQFPMMALGDALLGLAALVIFSISAPIDWSPGKIVFLVAAVIAGGLVEAGIQTTLCGFSFVMTSTASLRIFADTTITQFSGYPLTIFGRWGLYSLTFLFPMAFIAFLPATVLLGRADETPLPVWLSYCSPLVGLGWFVLGYVFFTKMTRYYTSPGS
jgi:ABC-2 type transport system permease protein